LDSVETPFGTRQDVIGGSAIYFSYAASFFTPVRLVGVVGEDAPQHLFHVFDGRPVDTAGLEVRKGSKTFRWRATYVQDMNEAQTLETQLNVLAERAPSIPSSFLDSSFVFLANTHPSLQQQMLSSLSNVRFSVADTMNLWIDNERDELLKLLKRIDMLVLNDAEARQLTGKKNLVEAARQVLSFGPKYVVVKKGEHGCLLCHGSELFALPAFPTERVVDPTGAGDSFAGGMMGFLASRRQVTPATVRTALAYGTCVASFTIADFSLAGLQATSREQIDRRLEELRRATVFE
jgi:sugar/nucleoside kinase (ribokinase family)